MAGHSSHDLLFDNHYRIPSSRMSEHDYNGGSYFVTICTHNRNMYFGSINNGMMHCSEIGAYTNSIIESIPSFCPYASVPVWVVMPNHIHLIVKINQYQSYMSDGNRYHNNTATGGVTGKANPMLNNGLGQVVRGFKAKVAHYAQTHDISFAWQPRFHDHIIRDRNEMNLIANYIQNNVAKWDEDCYSNPKS